MMKLVVFFLTVGLLASLVVAQIVVTKPNTDQKIGSTVDVKWDTTPIPKGVKVTDQVSVRIRCGKIGIPPKAVPHQPFTDGLKRIEIPDNSDLVGSTCEALIFDEDNDVTGSSPSFKMLQK